MRRIIAMCAFAALLVPIVGGSAFVFAQSEPDPMTNRFAPSTIHSLDQISALNNLAAANRASQQSETEALQPSRKTLGCSDTEGGNVRANQECTNVSRFDLLGRGQSQNETVGAVNPTDPDNVLLAQNDYRNGDGSCGFDYSLDGGKQLRGRAPAGELHGSGVHRSATLLGRLGRPGGGVRFRGLRLLRLPAVQSWA